MSQYIAAAKRITESDVSISYHWWMMQGVINTLIADIEYPYFDYVAEFEIINDFQVIISKQESGDICPCLIEED
jgi:hypothetical protein